MYVYSHKALWYERETGLLKLFWKEIIQSLPVENNFKNQNNQHPPPQKKNNQSLQTTTNKDPPQNSLQKKETKTVFYWAMVKDTFFF